jgi:glutathione S-transferase
LKLYYHPVSTVCRPIMQFVAEASIALDYELVDLFTGAHHQPPFTAVNPSRQVPVLEDGDFRLTESSAILKYIADKAGAAEYPKDLKARARVNERMDWFNTGLYRDLGYGVIYPQCLPHYKRDDEKAQACVVEWGRTRARNWLGVLDTEFIGRNAYVCGDAITIADYLGIGIVTLGEVVHLDYAAWPNVSRWIATMKARPAWSKTNEAFYAHFVGPYKDAKFIGL